MKNKIILAIVILVLIIGGIWYYNQSKKSSGLQSVNTQVDTTYENIGWKKYKNNQYEFEIDYPIEASIQENANGIYVLEGWADKNFQIIINESDDKIAKIKNSKEFVREEIVMINGVSGKKYLTALTTNTCTISYVLIDRGQGKNFFFNNLVECPSHPEGVDAKMLKMVNSFKII